MLELKTTTIIIEKDRSALSKTWSILKQFSELSIVAKATSAKKGLALSNRYVPHLLFVNVDLPDTNGLEFVRMLRSRNIQPYVVFIGSDSSMAFDSLELEPFDFFVLPLDSELITKMITRLKQKLIKDELMRKMDVYTEIQTDVPRRVFYQKKGIIVLRLDEIVFCKAELTSTRLKLSSGESVVVKSKISVTLEIINNSDFTRIGRSYFINRKYLRKIDKKSLKCILYYDGKTWEVPVSKNTIGILEKLNVNPTY